MKDKREIKLITKDCGNNNPDYICEECMNKVLAERKLYCSHLFKHLKEKVPVYREHLKT